MQSSKTFAGPNDIKSRFSRVFHGGAELSVVFYLFLLVTVIAVSLPLNPRMPCQSLDCSWEWGMNEAVAHHLSIGREVVFTYGPYAAVVSRTYHPSTDARMMWSSIVIAVSYALALVFLIPRDRRFLGVLLLLVLATFGNGELLLLSYAFLLVGCVLKWIIPANGRGRAQLNGWRLIVAGLMWSTLAFLPLTKGSLLLPFFTSLVASAGLLVYSKYFKLAVASLVVPMGACAVLWLGAGQSLSDVPSYLRDAMQLTSGYTEAMSTSWLILPRLIGDGMVAAFVAISIVAIFSIHRANQLTGPSKLALALLSASFLFVIFKHGFVKSDAVSGVFCSLTVILLIVSFVHLDKYLSASLIVAVALSLATSVMHDSVLANAVHERFGLGVTWGGEKRGDVFAFCVARALEAYPRTTYKSTWSTYADAWEGLHERLSTGNLLQEQFEKRVANIRNHYSLPQLPGTADLYEYELSDILASNDHWNPRPVFQSYTAYTPELLRLNEQHLRKADAPDWIFFNLQNIGGRLPSLDDGMSWPALLDNYKFVSYDGNYVLLEKKDPLHVQSAYDSELDETCATGATVHLPNQEGLLFAEVDLKPTLAGRLLITLFNPPELWIRLGLQNGTTKNYRVVSEMMSTDFLLSPLVNSTGDFGSMMKTGMGAEGERVQSISITPTYGGSLFWSSSYHLRLRRYVGL